MLLILLCCIELSSFLYHSGNKTDAANKTLKGENIHRVFSDAKKKTTSKQTKGWLHLNLNLVLTLNSKDRPLEAMFVNL